MDAIADDFLVGNDLDEIIPVEDITEYNEYSVAKICNIIGKIIGSWCAIFLSRVYASLENSTWFDKTQEYQLPLPLPNPIHKTTEEMLHNSLYHPLWNQFAIRYSIKVWLMSITYCVGS